MKDARGIASLVCICAFSQTEDKTEFCDISNIRLNSTVPMHAMQSGIVPPLVPFAQTFAAVITAALTGSLYYIATAPKGDPCSTDSLTVLICT